MDAKFKDSSVLLEKGEFVMESWSQLHQLLPLFSSIKSIDKIKYVDIIVKLL